MFLTFSNFFEKNFKKQTFVQSENTTVSSPCASLGGAQNGSFSPFQIGAVQRVTWFGIKNMFYSAMVLKICFLSEKEYILFSI